MSSPGIHTSLPSGTVTLVFTDIQGSSHLWETHGSAFKALLDEHNHLIREVAARWDGVEIKTEGDAFFLAFARASDAVQFTVDAQIAFRRCDWSSVHPELGELRVRMGMHTGEPILAAHPDGTADYFGQVVIGPLTSVPPATVIRSYSPLPPVVLPGPPFHLPWSSLTWASTASREWGGSVSGRCSTRSCRSSSPCSRQ